jgi:hypothetical protein
MPMPGIELRFLRRPSYSLLTILTELSWRKSEPFCFPVRNLLAGMQEYINIQREHELKQWDEIFANFIIISILYLIPEF